MNEIYTKLMKRQSLSEEAKAVFYEKMEHTQIRRGINPILRTAVIAGCVLLLIPVTILAGKNIFGAITVYRTGQESVRGKPGVGVEIKIGNVMNHPITDFSEHLQTLKESQVIGYESWEEAEKDLGIDLLSNSVCTDGETARIDPYPVAGNAQERHCQGTYCVVDGQLFFSKISAAYRHSRVKFVVSACLTAEHPTRTDEQLRQYHDSKHIYYEKYDPSVTTEQYTTGNGIPVMVEAVRAAGPEGVTDYTAYFAVNDISYEVWVVGSEGAWDDAHVYGVLCEILEGFVL